MCPFRKEPRHSEQPSRRDGYYGRHPRSRLAEYGSDAETIAHKCVVQMQEVGDDEAATAWMRIHDKISSLNSVDQVTCESTDQKSAASITR